MPEFEFYKRFIIDEIRKTTVHKNKLKKELANMQETGSISELAIEMHNKTLKKNRPIFQSSLKKIDELRKQNKQLMRVVSDLKIQLRSMNQSEKEAK